MKIHQYVRNWRIHRRLRKESASAVLSPGGWLRIECVRGRGVGKQRIYCGRGTQEAFEVK